MKKIFNFLLSATLHLVAVGVIIFAFWPLAVWYFNAKPLWGVDFYYTLTHTNFLRENLVFPPIGWNYAWFSGWPFLSSFPILHYYLILPFTYFFDPISSVKIWMLVSFALFFVGAYAVFVLLSKNKILSAILAIAAIYSVGVYGTLMWGGSLPNHATQAFLPWTIFFTILYLKEKSLRWLLLASLLTGLAIWGHPQIALAYIYPAVTILLFTFVSSGWKIFSIEKLKSWLLFTVTSFLIGLPQVYFVFRGALESLLIFNAQKTASSTASGLPRTTGDAIAAFNRLQPQRIVVDTNTTVFVLLACVLVLFILIFLIRRKMNMISDILPFVLFASYFAFYIWIFGFGISFYHGGWYRLFWTPPLWLGMVVAATWGSFEKSFGGLDILQRLHLKFFSILPIKILILIFGSFLLVTFSQGIKERIVLRSNPSSAFPDVLSLRTELQGYQRLKKEMVPSWFDPERTDYRFYEADQIVNIWWNALYKMPLARGYFDPPVSAREKAFFFLLDASLNQNPGTGEDQLVGVFNYPADIALNNTLFLVDWYGVKFFEAGHAGPTVYAPLPKSLTTDEYIKRKETLDFNKEKFNKGGQNLHFYELKDEFVSPILAATNASTIGVVASDQGYETVLRILADANFSSKALIPLKLGQFIERIDKNQLSSIDALILYDYDYKNSGRAFKLLSDYVRSGKKIFIDTGTEVKDSEKKGPLPEIFPIDSSVRRPLGKTWNFEIIDTDLAAGIDFSLFSPPIFDEAEWKFSYSQDPNSVRSDTNIILKNHGIPLMISQKLGNGEVIWSGLNFPYHVIRYHNNNEVHFFRNIISRLVNLEEKPIPTFTTQFLSPQKRTISVKGGGGVLFKEQAYPGWTAKIESDSSSQNLRIIPAGPAFPGFMFVSIPQNFAGKETRVTFSYHGSLIAWILTVVAIVVMFFILEEVLLGGRILGRLWRASLRKVHWKATQWWEKEDEE